jgi:hypothetical protein
MQPQAAPIGPPLAAAPRRALAATAALCAAAAAVGLIALSIAGQPLAGVAVALGLGLGAANGFLAATFLRLGIAFAATSLARLMLLTLLAVASGLLLGWPRMILVAAGIAAAQLVLSAASLREVLRSR